MNRCPTCGTQYANDARFCTKAGTKLIPMPGSAGPIATSDSGRGTAVGRPEQPKPATPTSLVDKVLDGRCLMVRRIGEAGMSFVYLANDTATKDRYAIKVLSAALSADQNAMQRLKREASLGMRLAHPNVCHIIRMGETQDGLVYVVMPFVEGEILSDRNNRRGTLSVDEGSEILTDIASGLHVAHEP